MWDKLKKFFSWVEEKTSSTATYEKEDEKSIETKYTPDESVIKSIEESLPELTQAVSEASDEIPPYVIAAIYDQESSGGIVDTNKNLEIGSEAWRMGLTSSALEDIGGSAETSNEAFRSATQYLSNRMKVKDYDPETDTEKVIKDYSGDFTGLYLDRYLTKESELYDAASKTFPEKLEFWKNYFQNK